MAGEQIETTSSKSVIWSTSSSSADEAKKDDHDETSSRSSKHDTELVQVPKFRKFRFLELFIAHYITF